MIREIEDNFIKTNEKIRKNTCLYNGPVQF